MRRTNRLQTSISEVRAAQGKLVEGWKEESDVTFLFSRDKSDTSPTVKRGHNGLEHCQAFLRQRHSTAILLICMLHILEISMGIRVLADACRQTLTHACFQESPAENRAQ